MEEPWNGKKSGKKGILVKRIKELRNWANGRKLNKGF